MIVSFGDKRTREFAEGKLVKAFSGFARQAEMKLDQLEAATAVRDLAALPGNRLEALKGDRKGQYSIRINDQWRLLLWQQDGAHRVEIVDYHQERDMAELLEEIHPGEILREEFMKPMGITARQLAADIDVSPSRISELVNGRRPITADTALRLGLYFGMDARFWMNLQTEYDIRVATRELKDKIAPRIRVHEHDAA